MHTSQSEFDFVTVLNVTVVQCTIVTSKYTYIYTQCFLQHKYIHVQRIYIEESILIMWASFSAYNIGKAHNIQPPFCNWRSLFKYLIRIQELHQPCYGGFLRTQCILVSQANQSSRGNWRLFSNMLPPSIAPLHPTSQILVGVNLDKITTIEHIKSTFGRSSLCRVGRQG